MVSSFNNNKLICEGASGHFFEINSSGNIVWEYINPAGATILSQGDDPSIVNNTVFRAKKFDADYPAFINRNLTPNLQIEQNPDASQCSILDIDDSVLYDMISFVNPVENELIINSKININKIEVYDHLGRFIIMNKDSNDKDINVEFLNSGIYVLKFETNLGLLVKKMIKK